ncbi:Major facilitator superfamily general substrate transporter [Cordyceps militaris]|uniref:Major facilitator superfamily general substrate transporter n=1 Tax=Cordyceps militaris TaxID=73501 RepID=A0A2H4SBP7_CORMI|nr:Major facilitator superfamily general substrate transporter [Cordyceps militaris]
MAAENYQSTFRRFNSPFWQVVLVSLVAFGCPGIYNALTGVGGGGQLNSTTQAKSHIALASVSAFGNLFIAPVVTNQIGPKWTLFLGGTTYVLYAGSLLAYSHIKNEAFVVAAGGVLGIGASFLWIAQGGIMTGYPLPSQHGRSIGIFWFIFNLGGFLGSIISFALNFHSTAGTVTDSTYIAFMCIMAAGCCCALFLLKPENVIREDGTRAGVAQRPSIWKEFVATVKILGRWETIALIPFWFSANCMFIVPSPFHPSVAAANMSHSDFYNYQQNTVNGKLFNIRTRSFNGAMYWLAQMVSSYLCGMLLDNKRMGRRSRAIWGYMLSGLLALVIWGGGLALQLRRGPSGHYYKLREMDLVDSGTKYAGPFVLYFCYGAFDAIWQTLCYWTLAYLADESPEQAARFVGAFKAFEATGSAMASKINSSSTNYNVEFGLNCGILFFGWLCALTVAFKVKDMPAEGDPALDGIGKEADMIDQIEEKA